MRDAIWEDGDVSLHPHELVDGLYVLGDGERWITLHRDDIAALATVTRG